MSGVALERASGYAAPRSSGRSAIDDDGDTVGGGLAPAAPRGACSPARPARSTSSKPNRRANATEPRRRRRDAPALSKPRPTRWSRQRARAGRCRNPAAAPRDAPAAPGSLGSATSEGPANPPPAPPRPAPRGATRWSRLADAHGAAAGTTADSFGRTGPLQTAHDSRSGVGFGGPGSRIIPSASSFPWLLRVALAAPEDLEPERDRDRRRSRAAARSRPTSRQTRRPRGSRRGSRPARRSPARSSRATASTAAAPRPGSRRPRRRAASPGR